MNYINILFNLFIELIRAGINFTSILGLFIVTGLVGGVATITRRMFDFTKVNKDE